MIEIETTIRIGKKGITPILIDEIKKQLKKEKKVKIKMLNSFIKGKDKKQIANDIALKTSAKLVSRVGFVFALEKEK